MTIPHSSSVLGRSVCVVTCAVVLAVQAGSASAAPRDRADEVARGHRAAAREVLVKVRPDQQGRGPMLAADPLADVEADEAVGSGRWRLVRSRSRSADHLAEILRARADVELAEPNFAVALSGTPDDLAAPLWALQNTGQRLENGDVATAGIDLDASHAWDITRGSRRLVVATVDTGVMQSHRDLAANLWTAPRAFSVTIGGMTVSCAAGTHGFNAITRTCDPADDHGHGTHVAGSIGAVGNNAEGVVGVNWTTSIMALKFMDQTGNGYISDVINAIEFALQARQAFAATGDADIRVLNNSWGGGGFSQALQDEISRASAAGMLFVASAGNAGFDHEVTPTYPSDYAGANVLSVAATDYRDRLGSFSDYGASHVQVGAPGVLIYSTAFSAANPLGSYETRSGTSMAAAYTSGVAALVLSHCNYAVGALRDALVRTVVPVAALAGRTQSGGRINAAAAVRSCDAQATSADVVIHAADIAAADRHGAWTLGPDGSAADGQALFTPDAGWSSTGAPLVQPVDYVDVRFAAQAGVPYRVWLRLKAAGNSKWNDSVWLQFSDARVNASPAYALNSTSGIAVNLENCSGCGVSGWGWQNGAYWLASTTVTFGTAGTQTLRVQTREDGVSFDQIVISSSAWLSSAPGAPANDSTIVNRTASGASGMGASSPPPAPPVSPYSGSPTALPGTVQAENFDNGGEGVAYHDTDATNSGGVYRATGVDIEPAAGGGYNVGWVAPGEWLAYSVAVQASGAYTAQFRVASSGAGGAFHLDIDGANVTGPLQVPDTGGWQQWVVVSRAVSVSAGSHVAKLVMDSAGTAAVGNFDWFALVNDTTATSLPGRLEAVGFDAGGEGTAYHDDSPGNSGGAFRASDVDIEACAEGGYNVGWIGAGEWLRFTVNVTTGGAYLLQFRVASPDGGGVLHLAAGPAALTGSVTVPRTGGWQQWTTVTVPVTLAAGRQTWTMGFDTGGFNVSRVEVVAQ